METSMLHDIEIIYEVGYGHITVGIFDGTKTEEHLTDQTKI